MLGSLAAVSPVGEQLWPLVLPWVDTETTFLFLAHIAACSPNDHFSMLLDGAGRRNAPALQIPPTLHLLPLPLNSPELNLAERLWDRLRENYVSNQVFSSWGAFVDHLCAGLHYVYQHREIVCCMTCFDWIEAPCLGLDSW